ncbi:MAG: hypothetical protein IT583_02230 [Verrucomicrobia bacterium]|nr:hypothetical protein [Verrucomicrobiota bacterium]
MKQKKLMVVAVWIMLCALVQADLVTLTISGTGNGSLNGISFSDKMFEWAITYDTTLYAAPWGENQPIFLDPVSVLTLEGTANPINITQEHGVFVSGYADNFSCAPIRMTGNNASANILSINGTAFWDGRSSFTASSFSSAQFNQFNGVSTDQGLLTISSGTLSSLVAAVPEPASSLLIGCGATLIALVRRFYGRS